ncbi:hypothetical protein MBLNU13_g07659t1 [Cladosporium sp. NU13]
MTAANSKRATSTPSAAPNISYIPGSTTYAARDSTENKTTAEARLRAKDDIERYLKNDQQAIWNARAKVRKAAGWDRLGDAQQERILKEAALDAIQYRKDRGIHVSRFYPEFADYTPPIVEGKRANSKDEKEFLLYKQLDLLESQGFRRVRDEESDDEEPNPFLKKEEGGDTPPIEDRSRRRIKHEIDLLRRDLATFKKGSKPAPPTLKQQIKRTTTPLSNSAPKPEENDEHESALSDLESESSASCSASESEEDEDRKNTTLVAVLRGQPLPKDLTTLTPSKPTKRLRRRKHRPTKINGLVAVFRGEIVKKEDPDTEIEWVWVYKKGLAPRKRVRGSGDETGLEVEARGQENKNKNNESQSRG